jgi:hypothetical protein
LCGHPLLFSRYRFHKRSNAWFEPHRPCFGHDNPPLVGMKQSVGAALLPRADWEKLRNFGLEARRCCRLV